MRRAFIHSFAHGPEALEWIKKEVKFQIEPIIEFNLGNFFLIFHGPNSTVHE